MNTTSQSPPGIELVVSYRGVAATENIWDDKCEIKASPLKLKNLNFQLKIIFKKYERLKSCNS